MTAGTEDILAVPLDVAEEDRGLLDAAARDIVPQPALSHPGRRGSGLLSSRAVWVVALTVVALAARLAFASRSYDIFIDEVSYTDIARNVAAGHGLTLYGQPFNVHPPLGFLEYAAAIIMFGIHGTTEQVLFQLRDVATVFGALVPAVIFLALSRFRSLTVAVVAALVVALDPFAILMDARVMLEPLAQLAMAGTFAAMAAAAIAPPGSARQRWWMIGAGLLGGATICTKETFGGVLLVALVALLVTGWVLRRKQMLFVVAVMLTGAGAGVVESISANGFQSWYSTKVTDFYRLIGASQQTGFHAPGMHVTLVQRLLADLGEFWPAYVVLGAGTVAAAAIVFTLRPWSAGRGSRAPLDREHRAVLAFTMWALCAAAYLVYATLFGSLEEQMYYIVLAPAAVSLVMWSGMVWETGRLLGERPVTATLGRAGRSGMASTVRLMLAALVVVVVCGDSAVWVQVHTRHDNEYRTFLAWDPQHVPNSAVISVTEDVAQFLVQGAVLGDWETVAQLKQHHVDYVLVARSLVQQRYTSGSPQFFQYVFAHGRLMFSVSGPSDGALQLWDVQPITGATIPGQSSAGPAATVLAPPAAKDNTKVGQ